MFENFQNDVHVRHTGVLRGNLCMTTANSPGLCLPRKLVSSWGANSKTEPPTRLKAHRIHERQSGRLFRLQVSSLGLHRVLDVLHAIQALGSYGTGPDQLHQGVFSSLRRDWHFGRQNSNPFCVEVA